MLCSECLSSPEGFPCFEWGGNCQGQYWVVASLMPVWRPGSACGLWSLEPSSGSTWCCAPPALVPPLFGSWGTYCCEPYAGPCSLCTSVSLGPWRGNPQTYVPQHSCCIFAAHCIGHLCDHIYGIGSTPESGKPYHTVLSSCIWSPKPGLSAGPNWSV